MPGGLGKPIDVHGRGDSNGSRAIGPGRVCAHADRRCRALIAVLSAATLLAPGFAGAAPATAATATPPAVAAPAPTVTDIVLGITASEDLQRATLARLEQAGQWRELADRVAALEARFDALPASAGGNRRTDRCDRPGSSAAGAASATCRPSSTNSGRRAAARARPPRARFRRPEMARASVASAR